MRCWRRSPIKRVRKYGHLSSNGAHSTACAPRSARSQRWPFCGHVCRAKRGVRIAERLRRSRENGGLAIMTGLANKAADVRYAYKASLIGAVHQFELTDEGLSWQIGGRAGIWPYGDIAAIRLSYRPVSMQSRRFRADIETADHQRIAILSTSWQTAALMAPQDQDYRAFITQLHQRMQKAGSKAALIGGIGPKLYAAGIVLLALVAIAISGLLVRALV